MNNVRKIGSEKVIVLLRRAFYNTPVMRWQLTAFVYDKVFRLGMPDLDKPILFRNAYFFVDPNDRSYVPSMVGGFYEEHELNIFEELAEKSDTLFDIGANVGMYSVIAARKNSAIRCFAFEPVEENQAFLEKNIKLNKVGSRVKLIKYAVSDMTGDATIHLSTKLSGTHSLSVDRGGEERAVRTITVDDFCKKSKRTPDLVKIDVEGHEASVFKGMSGVLKTKPTIFMEYVPELNKDMKSLIDRLAKIYGQCYVVDAVKGKVSKIELKEIDPNKRYNIVISKNKQHLRVIESYIHSERSNK